METPAMTVSITMPQLGESVTEGTVTRWLKDVGDTVEMDEPLLEVSTDKVDTEIPSPVAGVLVAIKAVEDDVVEVGAELAVVGDAAEATATPAPTQDAPAPETPAAQEPEAAPEPPPTPAPAAQAQPEPEAPTPAPTPPPAGPGTEVLLPALGESVTEGTVTRWLKNVGDAVEMDEPLLEVSTDKVDTEIPSPIAGTLLEVSVAEDETVPVGAVLAVVGAASAAPVGASAATPGPAAEVATPAGEATQVAPKSVPSPEQINADATTSRGSQTEPYASPIVRKLARDSGVDLTAVTPSAPNGRITKDDVRQASAPPATNPPAPAQPPPAPPAATTPAASTPAAPAVPTAAAARPPTKTPPTNERGRTEKMTRLRQVIASRMVESLQVSAQLTTVVEVDVTRIAALRTRAKVGFQEREGVSLSFLPFFARATLEALRLFPMVNASVNGEDNTVTYHDQSNLGIAVDTDRGLLVPVIRDAGDLTLAGLARRIADLAQRTRTSQVSPDELSGGTFTLTNTGSRGALFDTPIINQPQVGILGTGAVVKRAVVLTEAGGEDVIAIRSMVYLALTYDHRIVDGAIAAQFLTAIKARLESAEFDSELGV